MWEKDRKCEKKKQNRDRGSKKLELITFLGRQVCCWLSASDSRCTGAQCNENQYSNCPTGIQNPSLIPPPQLIQYTSVASWRTLMVLFGKRMLYTLFDLVFCNLSAGTSEYTASAKLDTEANTYTGRVTTAWRLLDCTIKSQWPSHWIVGYHCCPVFALSMHSDTLSQAWHNIP